MAELSGMRHKSAARRAFIQQLDRSIHDLLFVPVDTLERCGDPASSIEEVDLNPMPVHE